MRVVTITYKSNTVGVYLKPTKDEAGYSFKIEKYNLTLNLYPNKPATIEAIVAIDEALMSAIKLAAAQSFKTCSDYAIDLTDNSIQDKGFTPRTSGYRSPAMLREDYAKTQAAKSSEWVKYNNLVNEGGEGFNPHD